MEKKSCSMEMEEEEEEELEELEIRPDSDHRREFQFRPSSMISEIEELSAEAEKVMSVGKGDDDVYVAVGKKELGLEALRWALNNAVNPRSCVFLVHVYPPLNYIPTPVGRVAKSYLNQEQVNSYMQEENFRRKNYLQKYISLCADSKIAVETILIESDLTAKAILDLIPVLNIKRLVMGAKRSSRKMRRGVGKSEFVQKNAPEFCKVTLVYDGQTAEAREQQQSGFEPLPASPSSSKQSGSNGQTSKTRPEISRHPERNFFECACFSGKFVGI